MQTSEYHFVTYSKNALFTDDEPAPRVILKQVQDDEPWEVSVTGGIFVS